MKAITIVIRSGLGMQVESVRPYLKPGTPIAIGRGGAVIAEVADGNAIEDKRKAAEAAGGYIDSVERYMESADNLESVVAVLESALIGIDACAADGQSEPWAALRRIREITAAFLDSSGARAEQAYPGSAAARRPVNPGEQLRPAQEASGELCPLCRANNHPEMECAWFGKEKTLAFVQRLDKHVVEHAAEFNAAPAAALKPSIFDVITGTANLPPQAAQELPSREEHAAQIEQVAAGLREDQAELAKSILVLGDWLERVEIEDGYVGVPVIEAVEVVVTELKRQQKTAAPVVCRYGHWFAGDSDEATLIRERGICSDCAAVDDSWLGAQEPEGGGA